MSERFAVSLHRVGAGRCLSNGRGDHFDWFFAANGGESGMLVTWSTPICWPLADDNLSRRLPDHRARYLEYDGEISGDRGCVQRLVTGTCRLIRHDAMYIEFVVESIAMADSLNAPMHDHDVARLAIELCDQLAASKGDRIRLSTSADTVTNEQGSIVTSTDGDDRRDFTPGRRH